MKETWKNLKRVYSFAKGQEKNLIIFVIGSIILCIIGIIIPIFTSKQLINMTSSMWSKALVATLLVFLIEIFRNIISYVNRKYTQLFFRETMYKLQTEIGKNILDIEVSCIDKHTTGLFIQRLANDTSSLSAVFVRGGHFLTSIITDIGVFIAVLIISPIFFLYYLSIFLIILYLQRKRVFEVGKKDREFRTQKEKTAGLTTELVRGVRDIKMLNAENSFMKEVDNTILDLNQKSYELSGVERNYQLLIGSAKDVNNMLLALLLIYCVSKGYLALSLGIVIFSYRQYIVNLVDMLGYLMDYMKDFNISCERVFAILDSEEFKKETFGQEKIKQIKGNFEFKDVTFGYNDKKLVLDKINFKVNAHETVAFVGKSGVGKTTIFNLLCKLYNVNSGTITIDGIDINLLDKESIRGNITIISQNPYIFNMSIRDNLKLVKEDLTEEEMIEACKLACLDEFIKRLPEGYDTIVGESGITLSGGQRQRLAIARALVQKTKIILFDEATSALDNETQAKIQEAINNMKKDYTILIIAHRLSTVINSDRILFLEDGKIVQQGTHEELIKNNEEYRNLYEAEMVKD